MMPTILRGREFAAEGPMWAMAGRLGSINSALVRAEIHEGGPVALRTNRPFSGRS